MQAVNSMASRGHMRRRPAVNEVTGFIFLSYIAPRGA
jgi:hypothetical protein